MTTSNTPRRSEAELRNEHLAQGALLLHFEFKEPVNQRLLLLWAAIEKKGFLVASDGCLIPHKVHWFSGRARVVASTVACEIAHGRLPDVCTRSQVNECGWPEDEEVSHLCHISACCNPNHLVIEAKWKNRRRNYCGYNGTCDCGMVPPCVKPYRNSQFNHELVYLGYSDSNLSERLQALFASFAAVAVLPSTHYRVEDAKRRNRLLRRKREQRHIQQHKRKHRGISNALRRGACR